MGFFLEKKGSILEKENCPSKKSSILEKEIVRRKKVQFWRKKGSILEKDIWGTNKPSKHTTLIQTLTLTQTLIPTH
jgi:hypothetical protein